MITIKNILSTSFLFLVLVLTGCGGGGGGPSGNAPTYTIGGSISGLSGTGLVLQNNNGDDLAVSANDTFTFSSGLADGATYVVTVSGQPIGQSCTMTNSNGTLAGANVINVAVSCVNAPPSSGLTISVTVSGLSGSGLVLQNNLGDDLSISANGVFSFASALNDGELYQVSALGQPTTPKQHCIIANAIGKLVGTNVNDVQVSCVNIYANRAGIMESSLFGGSKTQGIAVGDVNGDGKPDVVTANNGHVNEVWFNDGERFIDSGQALNSSGDPDIPSQTFSITLGDIDGDGDLDIISGDFSFHSIWVNDGAGYFTDSGQSLIAGGRELSVGDIDNDGDLDFVSAGTAGGTLPSVRVFSNNPNNTSGVPIGNGVFSKTQSLEAGDTNSVELAYINGDVFLDLLVGNGNGQANTVWLNDGAGNFVDSGETFGMGNTYSIAVADIDGDGDNDVVIGNSDNVTNTANTVWTNNGSGVFTDRGQTFGNLGADSVALGDIDGDGDADLVVGNTGIIGQANTVWTNDGTGVFTDSGQSFGKSFTSDIKLVDMDGDSDLDFVAGNNYQQANVVYTNNGSGVFSDKTQPMGLDDSTTSISLGDIDDDGDLDMVTADSYGATRVKLNDGNGSYTESQVPYYGEIADSALGDLDGDGDPDLVLAGPASSMDGYLYPSLIYINDGTGAFTDSGQSLAGGATESIVLGDIDNDGDLDLISGNEGANKVWLNGGNGVFTDSGQSLGTYWTMDIELVDIDNDNDLDIVAANVNTNTLIWLNDGLGVFTDAGQALSSADSIAIGDIDGDSDNDLVMTRGTQNKVWLNNAGSFVDSAQSLIIDKGYSDTVELGDMDNDGDLDMISGVRGVGGLTALPNKVWLNDGLGTFTDSMQTLGSDGTASLAIGDIDGDSDLDIVTGSSGGAINSNYPESNRIYRNLTFTK